MDTQNYMSNYNWKYKILNYLFFFWSQIPNFVEYTGGNKIFQYIMVSYKMCHIETDNMVEVNIILERNYLSFLLTDFTPTVLSNLIAYSTNFFPRENFDAAIGVNLTILLVITTM